MSVLATLACALAAGGCFDEAAAQRRIRDRETELARIREDGRRESARTGRLVQTRDELRAEVATLKSDLQVMQEELRLVPADLRPQARVSALMQRTMSEDKRLSEASPDAGAEQRIESLKRDVGQLRKEIAALKSQS